MMLPPGTFLSSVAVVTGGGTGLGRAISMELARLGAKVAITSRRLENLEPTRAEIEAAGGTAKAVTCDIRDPEQVKRMFEEVEADFGAQDLLVNCAAGNFLVEAEKLSVNGWRSVLGIVLDGTFYCTREAAKRMIPNRRGSILNVIATYAWTGNPGTVHSAAAKAGVLAMTRTLAGEWAEYGVRVNAIAPGPADTQGASAQLWAGEGGVDRVAKSVPAGRLATGDEIADASVYLLSDCAAYITGECLTIDGGNWLGMAMFPSKQHPE